jgi:hypothetical protein
MDEAIESMIIKGTLYCCTAEDEQTEKRVQISAYFLFTLFFLK